MITRYIPPTPVIVEQMEDDNRDHWIYTHTIRSILQLFIFFRFLLILLFQMSVHMRRVEDNGQPLQGGNQLMMKMVERRNQRINVEHK